MGYVALNCAAFPLRNNFNEGAAFMVRGRQRQLMLSDREEKV